MVKQDVKVRPAAAHVAAKTPNLVLTDAKASNSKARSEGPAGDTFTGEAPEAIGTNYLGPDGLPNRTPHASGRTLQLGGFGLHVEAEQLTEEEAEQLLTFIAEHDLKSLTDTAREGRPAFKPEDRLHLRTLIQQLNGAQCRALRDVVVPPSTGQRLLATCDDPLAKATLRRLVEGQVGPSDVMTLLEAGHLGLHAKVDGPRRELISNMLPIWGIEVAAVHPDTLNLLERSATACRIAQDHGPAGLRALETFDHDDLETVAVLNPAVLNWIVAGAAPADIEHIGRELKLLGPERMAAGLGGLLQRKLDVSEVVGRVGVQRAVILGEIIAQKGGGERAYRALRGGWNSFWDLLRSTPAAGIRDILEHHDDLVDSYGSNETPLLSYGDWPSMEPKRTPALVAAEQRILSKLGLPETALDDLSQLTVKQANSLGEALETEIAAGSTKQSEKLDRELLGRRFVRFSYYDKLMESGVANPEHRYSKATFASYAKGEVRMRELAEQTRGRPLAKGELTEVMKELHRTAALGLFETGQTFQRKQDLGRLRWRPMLDQVGLGGKMLKVTSEQITLLEKNPYLSVAIPLLHTWPAGKGTQWRSIEFSGPWRVRFHVAALDKFVRENEGSLPIEELAAELHFRIVSIHPFRDGNGRTSKLMVDFLLLRQGIQPPIWNEGKVLLNHARWPQVVADSVRDRVNVVRRHWNAVVDPKSQEPQSVPKVGLR